MEITHQIAALEDELKLLKGEIKSILKELRAAVLASDNPFSANTSSIRSSSVSVATPDQVVLPSEPPAPAAEETPFSPRPVELPASQHELAAAPSHEATAPEAVPIRHDALDHDERSEARPASLFTIASLLSWAEDAIGTLGPRRYRIMLELAYFAELLSPEVRDVLREVAELSSMEQEPERHVSVNECLLQLRQLEAIVNGERVARIPRRRSRRRG
jgi:hypothetical protein